MKRSCLITIMFALFVLVGCRSDASSDPDDYVGEYVFRTNTADLEASPTFLILKKDHTAVEITFSRATGQVMTTEKKWDLSSRNGEFIGIGNFSHPVEGSPSHIKLGVNDDLGQYYEKVR
jgi:hypothetical protein